MFHAKHLVRGLIRCGVQATTVFGALRGLETFSQLVDRVACPDTPRGSSHSWPGPAAVPPAESRQAAAQAGEAAPAAEADDSTSAGVPSARAAGTAGRGGAAQAGKGLAGPWRVGDGGALAARRLAAAEGGPDGADGAGHGAPLASTGGALAGGAQAAGQPVRAGSSARRVSWRAHGIQSARLLDLDDRHAKLWLCMHSSRKQAFLACFKSCGQ